MNILTFDEKHYLLNKHNLMQPIQIQSSKKQKTFSEIFGAFLNSLLNFKHLPTEDETHS